MKIKVRKEIVNCSICKMNNDFLYLSDFSYGERLVLYDNGHKYAYINFLQDDVYDNFVEILTSVLEEMKESTEISHIQFLTNKIFPIACDKIHGTEIQFNCNKKCCNCDSDKFDDLLMEPKNTEMVELPIVTHEEWVELPKEIIKEKIIIALKNI